MQNDQDRTMSNLSVNTSKPNDRFFELPSNQQVLSLPQTPSLKTNTTTSTKVN
jgi:hypothetical protein